MSAASGLQTKSKIQNGDEICNQNIRIYFKQLYYKQFLDQIATEETVNLKTHPQLSNVSRGNLYAFKI